MDTVRVNSYQGWWFGRNMGNFTCKLCHASFYFLPSFSLFLLVAIAVDRFYAVARPFDRTPISRHVKKVILTLWIFSLILSALVFANGHLETKKESYLCHTHSPLKYSNGKELNVISLTPCRCHPYDAFGSSIHKNMHQTMVTSSTRRKSQSKPTPTSSYSDSKKGYPDNDRNRCFIRHLLGSFLCNNGTVTSWICAKQGSSIFSLVIGLLQWHQSLRLFLL